MYIINKNIHTIIRGYRLGIFGNKQVDNIIYYLYFLSLYTNIFNKLKYTLKYTLNIH
jgi:hypothetical protein